MSFTYYKIPTIRVRRHRKVASEIRGDSWKYGYVLINVNFPSYAVPSKWYLLSEQNEKIYLKQGWNTFGKDATSCFEFNDPTICAPVRLSIGVPNSVSTPMVHNFGCSCYFNGVYMATSRELKYSSIVTLFSGGTAILLKFDKDQN